MMALCVCHTSTTTRKKVHKLEQDEGSEDGDEVLFLGEILTTGGGWTAKLRIHCQNTHFKLDTGAAVADVGAQSLQLNDQELVKPK